MQPKTPGEVFADFFIGSLQKAAADGASRVVRHLEKEVSAKLGTAARQFENLASCNCSPCRVEVTNGAGETELTTVHASDCPAK